MMRELLPRGRSFYATALALLVLSACTTRGVREAPIDDRSRPAANTPAPAPITTPTPPPAARTSTESGQYVVQRGDTLYSIAHAFSVDYRDLARWNGMDDPTKISVGQTLRVTPPTSDAPSASAVVAAIPVAPAGSVEARPLGDSTPTTATTTGAATSSASSPPAAPTANTPLPSAAPATAPPTVPQGAVPPTPPSASTPNPASAPTPLPQTASAAPSPSERSQPAPDVLRSWLWPTNGKVTDAFDEGRNKGIDIAGIEGDPVLASNDGEVVYSGSGLRGYGNLVIIKHADEYISAYAHNKQILVKQGQTVKRGQRIAELGKTDANQPKLHFEIRYKGKPVDPLKHLPPR